MSDYFSFSKKNNTIKFDSASAERGNADKGTVKNNNLLGSLFYDENSSENSLNTNSFEKFEYSNTDLFNKKSVAKSENNEVNIKALSVSEQLYAASDGLGTDEELLKNGINNITSKEILKNVNNNLKNKGSDYTGDKQTLPVESLILDEMSHSKAKPVLKTLIDSGAMTKSEQANTVKRELEYDIKGGITGYSSTNEINQTMNLVSDSSLRKEVESKFKNDYPNLKPDDGSYVRSFLKDDGWNSQEIDQFETNWIKNGAYKSAKYEKNSDGSVKTDINGEPVVADKGDQEHRNGVIGRLVFDYNDKEALNKGLDSVNSDTNSPDLRFLNKKAGEEIANDKNGKYPERFKGQDNVQRYLAGFHSDKNGKVDADNLSASNTLLYKGEKPPRVQAEEALYYAKNGDFSKTFESMEPKTYSAMSEMIKNGDIKGVRDMNDLYNKALNNTNSPNEKMQIKANAMISGQVNFNDKDKADFCIKLMHSIDENKGRGGSTSSSAKYKNTADYQTEQLKSILQNNPQIMKDVKARVENEKFSYDTVYGGEDVEVTRTTDTKNDYKQLLADIKHIAKDEVFLDENGNKITDFKQIENIKNANMQSLTEMRKYVADLERDYKKGINEEGIISDMANGLSKHYGFGTDRDDVANEFRNAKLMLQQFEAASLGKLRDSDGNVVSAQDFAKQILEKQNKLAETNSEYKSTIAYGKIAILAPVLAVTTVATGGVAAAAGLGTVGTTGVTAVVSTAAKYGTEAIEYNTSNTGNIAENRENNFEETSTGSFLSVIGGGQQKIVGLITRNMGNKSKLIINTTSKAVNADKVKTITDKVEGD